MADLEAEAVSEAQEDEEEADLVVKEVVEGLEVDLVANLVDKEDSVGRMEDKECSVDKMEAKVDLVDKMEDKVDSEDKMEDKECSVDKMEARVDSVDKMEDKMDSEVWDPVVLEVQEGVEDLAVVNPEVKVDSEVNPVEMEMAFPLHLHNNLTAQ